MFEVCPHAYFASFAEEARKMLDITAKVADVGDERQAGWTLDE